MRENVRRILGMLLSLAMLCSILPMTVLAAESDGYYFKLEESDAKTVVGFNEEVENAFFSGGKVRVLGTQTAPDATGYYMEFEVDVEEAGNYKIWVYGGQSGTNYASVANIIIDDTTTLECTGTTDSTWGNSVGVNFQVAYQSVDAYLTAGTHTIKYHIGAARPSGDGWVTGALDFMLIVPEDYTWTPSKTELPIAPVSIEYMDFHADGYAWLQETDAFSNIGFTTAVSNGACGDGAAKKVVTTTAPGENGYSLDYYLNVPEAGEYEIFVHGTNTAKAYNSAAKVTVDGETVAMTNVSGDEWIAGDNWAWSKGTIELEEGPIDLRYIVDVTRNDAYYYGFLDMICIVPASYEWTQSISDKPVKPAEVDPIAFHADGYAWLQETDATEIVGFDIGVSNAACGEGAGLKITTTTTPSEDGYYLDYCVEVPASGSYEIWVHGTNTAKAYNSAAKVTVDGETVEMTTVVADQWIGSDNWSWTKGTVELQEGLVDIRYVVDVPKTQDNATYYGFFDMMCVVPVSYGWTQSVTDKPIKPAEPISFHADGYAWLQETDATEIVGFTTSVSNAACGDNAGVKINTTAAPGTEGYYVDYYLDVPASGSYEIWVHGTNTAVNYNSAAKVTVDGQIVEMTNISGAQWIGSDNWSWTKGTVELQEGTIDLRYVIDVPKTGDNKTYYGFYDMICVVPVSYEWAYSITEKPVKPVEVPPVIPELATSAWIEGESSTVGNYGTSESNAAYSDGMARSLNRTDVVDGGYYTEYSVNLKEGTYDIYFRGADDAFSEKWASNAVPSVNGVTKEYTVVQAESWVGSYAIGWVKVSGVEITEAENTIRWTYPNHRTGDAVYFGALDAIVVVPSGAPFEPVRDNIAATAGDFEMCTLLAGTDISNVTGDIVLPTELADGTAITWASNNTAITNNGIVTRPGGLDVIVSLTATAGTMTKTFLVTVKGIAKFEITNFAISGTVEAGQTVTATANVKRNDGESGEINLILAVYDNELQLVAVDICEKIVATTAEDFNCSVSISDAQAGTLHAKAFLWTDFSELEPITSGISTLN